MLNVSESLSLGIFRVLSAILWIGNLQFSDSESEACQLTRKDGEIIKKIAVLLGIPEAHVRKCCTVRQISVKGTTTDIALKYHEVYNFYNIILNYWGKPHTYRYYEKIAVPMYVCMFVCILDTLSTCGVHVLSSCSCGPAGKCCTHNSIFLTLTITSFWK